ncbi:MAG: restriction endonuclease subunit S [Bifidobacterium bifidum]
MTEQAKVPEIRFAGFTDPWEQRKLGEFSKKNTIKNANGALSETFTNSAEQGVISQLDYFDHDITNDANISGYYVVQPDDFVYNPRISATAPCGPINRNRLNRAGVMSPLYTVFSVDASMDKTYLEHYFKTSRWHDFMFLEGNTGARSDRFSISDATFFEMPIWCPEISEQMAIAKQLETTDTLITLHQRKYDKLVVFKKSMLEKMFPKDGESVPEIRFAGFTDPWEQRKFSELASLRRGLTYSPADIRPYGQGIRVLRSSNIDEDEFTLSNEDVFVDETVVGIELVQEGEILITAANGSPRLVGKRAIINGLTGKTVHGGFMLCAHAEQPDYVAALMGSRWYQHFLATGVAGGNGSIGNLDKAALEDEFAFVPSIEEQELIGVLFSRLDDLITLHQRKLELLQNIKKSLLDKMFV